MLHPVELTRELIRQQSVLGSEHAIAKQIHNLISPYSSKVYLEDIGDGRENVIAFGKGKGRRTVLLNAHMDTVEVMNNWIHNPFGAEEEDGKIYGLGACDMKSGLAIFISLYSAFSQQDLNLIFTACADEEGDSLGAYTLIQYMREKNINPDVVLISEPTNERVMLGARGRVVFEIEVKGRSAHGARPHLGINAIMDAGKILGVFEKLPLPEHDKLGIGSFCPLKISGGSSSLSVPEECRIILDRHYVLGETQEGIRMDIVKAIEALGLRSSVRVEFVKRKVPFLKPYVCEENELVSMFREIASSDVTYGQSVGDFNLFGELWPTIVYGCKGGNWHSGEEFVEINSISHTYDTYSRFLSMLV